MSNSQRDSSMPFQASFYLFCPLEFLQDSMLWEPVLPGVEWPHESDHALEDSFYLVGFPAGRHARFAHRQGSRGSPATAQWFRQLPPSTLSSGPLLACLSPISPLSVRGTLSTLRKTACPEPVGFPLNQVEFGSISKVEIKFRLIEF